MSPEVSYVVSWSGEQVPSATCQIGFAGPVGDSLYSRSVCFDTISFLVKDCGVRVEFSEEGGSKATVCLPLLFPKILHKKYWSLPPCILEFWGSEVGINWFLEERISHVKKKEGKGGVVDDIWRWSSIEMNKSHVKITTCTCMLHVDKNILRVGNRNKPFYIKIICEGLLSKTKFILHSAKKWLCSSMPVVWWHISVPYKSTLLCWRATYLC